MSGRDTTAEKIKEIQAALARSEGASRDLATVLRDCLGALREEERGGTVVSGDAITVGELEAVLVKLMRIDAQIERIWPSTTMVAPPDAAPAAGEPDHGPRGQLAAIRLRLDAIQDRLAILLPTQTSARGRGRFHGTKHMTDGDAIRADRERMTRGELLLKWCLNSKRGVSGGKGEYTRRQIQAVLAQESGGHRRRRHLTGLSVAVGAETNEIKT